MKIEKDSGLNSGGVIKWFLQRITGAFLLFGLLVHFWVLHFFPPEHGEITFETVMARLQHPLWKTFDILFLLVVLYHGMNGIQIVINDYIQKNGWRILIVGFLWIGALFLLVKGTITILSLT
jgi:succinate dehydrogenase / fumarate reductase membrane anchor subunit